MAPPSPARVFVGRRGELATLEGTVAGARAGVPAVVLIGGEAGVGKSTLVQEAAHRAGVSLLVGRCIPMAGEAIPLAPVAELVRTVRRTSAGVLADLPALEPVGAGMALGAGTSERAAPAGAVLAAVLQLLGRLSAGQPLLVAIEDLHWADALTWDLTDFLARNLTDEHVVVAGTYRDDQVAVSRPHRRRLAELTRLPAVARISLAGLARDEVAATVAQALGRPAPPGLVDDVMRRGEGNPFFTEQLVAAHVAGETIPAVLSDLIVTDLGELDEDARRVVDVLAVAGRDLGHDLLTRLVDLDEDRLDAALRAALEARLIVVSDAERYRLRHHLIGEVAYDELLPSRRRQLHGRIAEALVALPPPVLARPDRAGELAIHLDRAGDRAAAFVARLNAADAAETMAPGAASRHLERALDLWTDVGEEAAGHDRGQRLWQAAELASGTGSNERAIELAREAFDHHGPPPGGEAWGHERLGRYLWVAGRLGESQVEFDKAAVLLGDDPGREEVRPLAGLAQADLMFGHYGSAEARARRVLTQLAEATTDPSAWAMAQRVLGVVVAQRGDPAEGINRCRAALGAAPNAQTRALAAAYLGIVLLDAGRYDDAVSEMLAAVDEAHRTGVAASFAGFLDALAAEGLLRLGRYGEAEALLAQYRLAETFPIGAARLAGAGALVAARRGEHARAHALLTEAESQPGDTWSRTSVDRCHVETCLALGEWKEAADVADRALASGLDALPSARAGFALASVVAGVELALDARARREPVDIDATAARLTARIERARAAFAAGDAHIPAVAAAHLAHAHAAITALGDADPDAWAAAAARWEQVGDGWWVAVARLGEAGAAATTGDLAQAAVALRTAHQLAVAAGAAPLLGRVEALARRTRLSVDTPVPAVLGDAAIDRLGLTPREAEVLALVATGQTNREIGEALYVSDKTVSVHVSSILRKLGVTTRVEAAAVAQRLGVG